MVPNTSQVLSALQLFVTFLNLLNSTILAELVSLVVSCRVGAMLHALFDSELKTERNTSQVLIAQNGAKHTPGASGSTTLS